MLFCVFKENKVHLCLFEQLKTFLYPVKVLGCSMCVSAATFQDVIHGAVPVSRNQQPMFKVPKFQSPSDQGLGLMSRVLVQWFKVKTHKTHCSRRTNISGSKGPWSKSPGSLYNGPRVKAKAQRSKGPRFKSPSLKVPVLVWRSKSPSVRVPFSGSRVRVTVLDWRTANSATYLCLASTLKQLQILFLNTKRGRL